MAECYRPTLPVLPWTGVATEAACRWIQSPDLPPNSPPARERLRQSAARSLCYRPGLPCATVPFSPEHATPFPIARAIACLHSAQTHASSPTVVSQKVSPVPPCCYVLPTYARRRRPHCAM